MKLTAPFTAAQVKSIERMDKPPLCRDRADTIHTTNRPPWYTAGQMKVTQAGLICPVCGYVVESVTIRES